MRCFAAPLSPDQRMCTWLINQLFSHRSPLGNGQGMDSMCRVKAAKRGVYCQFSCRPDQSAAHALQARWAYTYSSSIPDNAIVPGERMSFLVMLAPTLRSQTSLRVAAHAGWHISSAYAAVWFCVWHLPKLRLLAIGGVNRPGYHERVAAL
eukprot:6461026-Amphidinium_carterae.3